MQAEKTVSTAGLSGISLYDPGALTLVAGAGTPISEIEVALAAEGQRLSDSGYLQPPSDEGGTREASFFFSISLPGFSMFSVLERK